MIRDELCLTLESAWKHYRALIIKERENPNLSKDRAFVSLRTQAWSVFLDEMRREPVE